MLMQGVEGREVETSARSTRWERHHGRDRLHDGDLDEARAEARTIPTATLSSASGPMEGPRTQLRAKEQRPERRLGSPVLATVRRAPRVARAPASSDCAGRGRTLALPPLPA